MQLARVFGFVTFVAYAGAVSGCGGTTRVASQLGEHSIAPKVAPLSAALLTPKDITAVPPGSAQRAFLTMWSELQWQSYTDAISHYPSALVHAVGETRMLQALEFEASLYRTSKPLLHGGTDLNGRVSVRYTLSGSQLRSAPSSITWQREGGRWVVYYDPSLDAVLRSWALAKAEQINSSSSGSAAAASFRAAELQSRYVAGRRG